MVELEFVIMEDFVLLFDNYLELVGRGKEFINKPFFDSLPELKTQGIKELLDM